jgi:hypothetical protein
MGSPVTKELTVVNVTLHDDYCEIETDNCSLYLYKDTNFYDKFNKLKIGSSHKFTFDINGTITDIRPAGTYEIFGEVEGILDMSIEWNMGGLYQVAIKGKKIKLIIDDEQKRLTKVGSKYKFHYQKMYGEFYLVIKIISD